MDTAFQALMKAMLNHGWFTKSSGEDGSYTGYFGYVTNTQAELKEIREAFSEVIEAYGDPKDEDLIGSFVGVVDAVGTMHIFRHSDDNAAKSDFNRYEERYQKWLGN